MIWINITVWNARILESYKILQVESCWYCSCCVTACGLYLFEVKAEITMVGLSFLGNPTRLSFDACCEELLLFPGVFVACASPLGLGLSWFPGWFWHLQALRSLPFWGSLHVVANDFPNPLSRFGFAVWRYILYIVACPSAQAAGSASQYHTYLRLEMLQNPSKSRSVMVCLEHLGEHVYFYHAWCPKIPIRSTETTAGYDPQASCLYFTQLGKLRDSSNLWSLGAVSLFSNGWPATLCTCVVADAQVHLQSHMTHGEWLKGLISKSWILE